MSAMLHQNFNDLILLAMLLHEYCHSSVTIATMELSNVLLSPLAECCSNGVTLTSIRCHCCYDDRSITSFVQEHGIKCMPCSTIF